MFNIVRFNSCFEGCFCEV